MTGERDFGSRASYNTGFESIGSTADLDAVAEGSSWQNFERLTGYIFEQYGFRVAVNTVKTRDRHRRQYDVIARKGDRTVLAECKRWSGNRYRLPALKRAVADHRERAAFYEAITRETAVPVIVTLIEEEVRVVSGVPLVPVHRLNAFLSELEAFPDLALPAGFEDDGAGDADGETDSLPGDRY